MSPPGPVPDASSCVPDQNDPASPDAASAARSAGAELAHKRARARARRRAHGRVRSARRLEHEPFTPPPGWQHRPALDGREVLVDQAAALERVRELVDAERWRADRHASWSAMLAALVHHMDWETGLATITREALAAVGGVAVRTVTTMLRWAREAGLLAVVEAGATAAFLGTPHNRAQTYAVVLPAGAAGRPQTPDEDPPAAGAEVGGPPSDLLGDTRIHPPTSHVKDPSLEERQQNHKTSRPTQSSSWPLWQVPETPTERSAAAQTLASRLGIRGHVPAWRLRALLACWWRAGACVAGLLHALERHPDHPDHARGDALRGARDPIRVLGHRLQPWLGRLDELPTHRQGRHGDYRAAQAARLEQLTADAAPAAARPVDRPPSAARIAARDEIRAQLATRSPSRTTARRGAASTDSRRSRTAR